MDIKEYEKYLQDKAFELLSDAFNKTPPEILFLKPNDVKILLPKYFYDIIADGNPFTYRGYTVDIGYENAIIFFNKEYGFINNRIYKYIL